MLGSTITFAKDFGSFMIQTSVEVLPEQYQNVVGTFMGRVSGLVVSTRSVFNSVLYPVVLAVHESVRRGYDELNRQSAQVIDPLVRDFEKRYPSSAGRIGSSLLDRFLLIVWLLFLVRVFILCLRGLRRLVWGKRQRHRRHNKVFKGDPLFGQNPVTPPQNKGSAPSSCSSGNATPEKRPEPPSALRTVKKRIVISR